MHPRPGPDPVAIFVRLAGGTLLAAAVPGLIAWFWFADRPPEQGWAMAGIAAALVGAWCGNLPPAYLIGANAQRQAGGALAGLGVRFFVSSLLALYLAESIPETQRGLQMVALGWLGACQLLLLGTDVGHQIVLARREAEVR